MNIVRGYSAFGLSAPSYGSPEALGYLGTNFQATVHKLPMRLISRYVSSLGSSAASN
jgi:hypothetical protein